MADLKLCDRCTGMFLKRTPGTSTIFQGIVYTGTGKDNLNMQGDFCRECTEVMIGVKSGSARLMNQGTLTHALPMLPDVGEGTPQITRGKIPEEDRDDYPYSDPNQIPGLDEQTQLPQQADQ